MAFILGPYIQGKHSADLFEENCSSGEPAKEARKEGLEQRIELDRSLVERGPDRRGSNPFTTRNREPKIDNHSVGRGKDLKLKASNVAFALRHPREASLVVLYGKWGILLDRVAHLAGASGSTARGIFNEISSDSPIERHIREELQEAGGGYRAEVRFRDAYCLYTFCRLVRPRTVIETGVATGVSSAFILQALEENSIGTLHSIDLPRYQTHPSSDESDCSLRSEPGGPIIPLGKEPGFVVPTELRKRWNLALGPSEELLPRLVSQVGDIDLFFHDSAHTYEMMTFEFETVWPKIREGGLLLSHDVEWNSAFSDFGARMREKPVFLRGTGIGGLRK